MATLSHTNQVMSFVYTLLMVSVVASIPMEDTGLMTASVRARRAVTRHDTMIWPNATIPYHMDNAFGENEQQVLFEVLNDWTRDTCVRFVQTNYMDKYWVAFTKTHSQVCYSKTGVQYHRPMPQIVHLHEKCFLDENRHILSHEIGHLFGFFHEHNRPDRDRHIDIIWKNVRSGATLLFQKRNKTEVADFGSPYDLGSVMQYPLDYQSIQKGVPTMAPKKNYKGSIGNNTKPSATDIQQLKYLYGCEKYVPVESGSGEMDYMEDSAIIPFQSDTIHYSAALVSPSVAQSIPLIQPSSYISSQIITPKMSLSEATIPSITTSTSRNMLLPGSESPLSLVPKPSSSALLIPESSLSVVASSEPPLTIPKSSSSQTVAQPLPTNIQDQLFTGHMIGLQTEHSPKANRNFWLTCTEQRCRVRQCPGKTFNDEKQKQCTDFLFMFKKYKTVPTTNTSEEPVLVGDSVILYIYHTRIAMNCKNLKCKLAGHCRLNSSIHICREIILNVFVTGKSHGDTIMDGDLLEFQYHNETNEVGKAWISCEPLLTRKCSVKKCLAHLQCEYERFYLHIL